MISTTGLQITVHLQGLNLSPWAERRRVRLRLSRRWQAVPAANGTGRTAGRPPPSARPSRTSQAASSLAGSSIPSVEGVMDPRELRDAHSTTTEAVPQVTAL